MPHAKVRNSVIVTYPYTFDDLRKENPNTSYDGRFTLPEWYAQTTEAADTGATVVEVVMLEKPSHDDTTQEVTPKNLPELIDGVWSLGWVVGDKSSNPLTTAQAKRHLTMWINRLTAQVQDKYPDVVQKNWKDEEGMAQAFIDGTATEAQATVLASDAAAKGRTSEAHAQVILDKAAAFRDIALQMRTLWLETDRELDDATNPTQHEDILSAARAKAQPLIETYGLSVSGE